MYDLVNVDILGEIKLLILSITGDSNIQEPCKLSLVMEFIFCEKMGLQSFKFLNIMLVKNRDNIIDIEEDDDLVISKTARFIKNECKI